MIHILAGAAVGFVLGAATSILTSRLTGSKITWKTLLAGGIGGAVGGAITAATFGAGGLVAASATRAITGLVVSGAASGATGQVTNNLLEHRPVGEHVVRSTLIGGGSSVVTGMAGRALEPAAEKLLPAAALLLLSGDNPPKPRATPAGAAVPSTASAPATSRSETGRGPRAPPARSPGGPKSLGAETVPGVRLKGPPRSSGPKSPKLDPSTLPPLGGE